MVLAGPLVALVALATGGLYSARQEPRPLGVSGRWHLILNSEFTGSTLPTEWHIGWFGTGVTAPVNPREDDCYSPKNVSLPGDGTLHLEVTSLSSTCDSGIKPFTGALVSTNPDGRGRGFQYTYGVMQARVFLPGHGTKLANWPAVWAVTPPSETYGEDDVFEGLSGHACWHYRNDAGAPGDCDWSMTPGWHTFASDWEPGSISYYYDGIKVGQEASTSSEPMYIILNNTTSASNLDIAGPSSVQVQYVRVWQHS
jgi:beta-glucanase (GH16 family)